MGAGRIRADDKTTMKLVLDAVPDIGDNMYSVIINKVTPGMERKLKKIDSNTNMTGYEQITSLLMQGVDKQTNVFYYSKYNVDMDDAEDVVWQMPWELHKFIDEAPEVVVNPRNVNDVQTKEFDEINRELELKLSALLAY